jgi:hypothetical protein
LATRRRVAIQNESHWGTTKNGTRSRARVGRQHRLVSAELNVDVFEMGLLILTRVKLDNFHFFLSSATSDFVFQSSPFGVLPHGS